MAGLKPIKLLSARERVIAALRKAILSGELPAGTIVTLDEIASQLEVSNTPVREAFQQLIYEGFLAQQRNRRVEVLNIGSKFIRDHFEARAIMEKSCAALACKRATEEDFKEMKRINEKSIKAMQKGDMTVYTRCNYDLHHAIWTAAGNDKLIKMLSDMWNGLAVERLITVEEYAQIAQLSFDEHQEILRLIFARDAKQAETAMECHIMRSCENLLEYQKEQNQKSKQN